VTAAESTASLSGWPTLLVAVAAALIGLLAYVSDRSFRTRDGLSKLLERFEAAEFYVLMWRIEQLTRGEKGKSSSFDRVNINELAERVASAPQGKAKQRLVRQAFAQDWDSERAHMLQVYFFALRVNAWLVSTPFLQTHRARLLNDTFGYQLLGTLLNHRKVALRAERVDKPASYYPTQYGCLDLSYRELVDKLAEPLLNESRPQNPAEEIRAELR
jgi:hypothetical protein